MSRTAIGRRLRDANILLATLGIGLCLMLLYVLTTLGGQRMTDVRQQRPSSFFTDATGTRAIYFILQQLLPAAAQWRRPPALLPPSDAPEAPTTLLVFGPQQPLSVSWAQALDDWMARGGQVVLATHHDWRVTAGAGETAPRPSGPGQEQAYLQRHGFTIVADSGSDEPGEIAGPLVLRPYRLTWEADSPAHEALVSVDEQVLVASKRLGQGRLVVVPDAHAFANQRLRDSHNAVWLVTLCATWGNGRVLIDEFHHGFGRRRGFFVLLAQFLRTPWGWTVLQGLLAGGLYLYGPLRRFGRPVEPLPLPRRNLLDMAEARGGLLAAARAKQLAVECLHHHLEARLRNRTGDALRLPTMAPRERLAAKAPQLLQDFDRYMSSVQQTLHGTPVSDRDFLDLGQLATRLAKEFRAP
jgi:hypothetical protein